MRVIWGFSNTTFFHTAVTELPPGIQGQSYHPYGTGTRKLPAEEAHRDHPDFNVEGFTPAMEIRMPEGWAHTFIKTESLMRLLNPAALDTIRGFPPEVRRAIGEAVCSEGIRLMVSFCRQTVLRIVRATRFPAEAASFSRSATAWARRRAGSPRPRRRTSPCRRWP